ncbi:hypothetical protein [Pseudoglutamicibacter cumminsii]|uniref:hypothetical protein n=1 Tax=Pseudoglutamicibacter cumminsii TaxID=156979 RepID=UPI00195720F7|nr:hypothetical protein [Pseudoglutamicibacter cumminsii]MBM7796854.1 transcriptional regulator with XRE-family HTH domain [Pseudoglutamicibacter cumminsii]
MSRLSDHLNSLNRENLSLREIEAKAAEAGQRISFTTAGSYMRGQHPDPPNRRALEAFAAVFGVTVDEIVEATTDEVAHPYVPREGSERLTDPQRRAVDEIIRLLVEHNDAHDDHTHADTGAAGEVTSISDRAHTQPRQIAALQRGLGDGIDPDATPTDP